MFLRAGIKQNQPGFLQALVIIVLVMVVASCNTNKERKSAANEIKINLIADKDINPNENGHPAPLNVLIYNVREVDLFSNADFFEVIDGASKSLQSASSKIYEAILQPGESRTIFLKSKDDIETLGVVGAYRNINDATWLVTWDLPKKRLSWWGGLFGDNSLELNVYFKKTAMTIKKMD